MLLTTSLQTLCCSLRYESNLADRGGVEPPTPASSRRRSTTELSVEVNSAREQPNLLRRILCLLFVVSAFHNGWIRTSIAQHKHNLVITR